jgi:hypothetical protein
VPFPTTPLALVARIAPGANPVDPTSYVFTDITPDVRASDGIQITVGRQDETGSVDTTQVRAAIDNRSGNYSPRNPLGAYYGSLAKGTPLSVGVTLINDQFNRTVASGLGTDPDSGITWPGGTSFSVNGSAVVGNFATDNQAVAVAGGFGSQDFDLVYTSYASAVPVGANFVIAAIFWLSNGSDYYRAHTEFDTSGIIKVKIQKRAPSATTDVVANTSTGVAFSANTKIKTRVQVLGGVVRMRAWLASGSEPSSWNIQASLGTVDRTAYGTGLYLWRVAGMTTGPIGFVDDFRYDAIRAITPVPEWPVRWGDQAAVDVTAPIVGAGPLRRLSQGQAALRSPMYRQVTQYSNLVGHWPLEDPSGATALTNTTASGTQGTLLNTTLGTDGGPPGALSVAQSGAGSIMTGAFKPASSTAGWQFAFSAKLATAAPAAQTEMIRWTTSNGYQWSWYVASGSFRILVTAGGTTLLDSTVLSPDPTNWIQYRTKVSRVGTTVTVERAWFTTDGAIAGTTDTFTGTIGYLQTWRQAANTLTQDALWSHIFGVTTIADDLQSTNALQSFNGYIHERAGVRAQRLATEEGIPLMFIGTPTNSATMGVQTSSTLLDLFRDCEAADQAVLSEAGAGLAFRTRRLRYNAPVGMALNFSTGHVSSPPEPTDDDQQLRNQIKLSRTSGSTVTAQDDDSIAVNGLYSDELTINVQDDSQLPDQAGWLLHLGTLNELRWPKVTLDLARNPSLIGTWCQMTIGSRITITNPPAAVPGTLDLLIEGWTETLSEYGWTVEINCSPASAWKVAIYDASAYRYDSKSTTLLAGLTKTATSATFVTTDSTEYWSTTGVPYDVLISGEQCTVTAITSATGGGQQTATLTRAVNGISKALPAAAEVHVATPGRYAL